MNKGYFKGVYPTVDNQIVFALYEELNKLKELDFRQLMLDQYLVRFTDAPDNGESFWTTKELSEIMQVTTDTICKYVTQHNLPGNLTPMGSIETYQFDKERVINFVVRYGWYQDRNLLINRSAIYERVRDWYCFASEAPLRFSDLKALNPTVHLRTSYDSGGRPVKAVHLYPQKTKRHRVLQQFPLSEYCLSIMDKYSDEVNENQVLPIVESNATINESLNKLLELSALFNDKVVVYEGRGKELIESPEPRWKELTFHTSRHNFGTNMAARGMDVFKIMQLS